MLEEFAAGAPNFLALLNSHQSATTITAATLVGNVAVDAPPAPPVVCLTNDDGTWAATWSVTASGDALNITVSSNSAGPDGWVGIGFHAGTAAVTDMGPGDFYVGSVAGGGVGDYHLSTAANGAPQADAQDDVVEQSCTCVAFLGSCFLVSCFLVFL